MKGILLCLCFFTLAATVWLGIMETILRHPGFVLRILVVLLLAAQSLTTVFFLVLRERGAMRIPVALGGGLIAVFGVSAVLSILRAAHFEGYVFVIGCALILQGALTILVFVDNRRLPSRLDIG